MNLMLLPPVREGDLLMLRDEDYLFGRGEVWLRIVAVWDIRWWRGKPWIFLRGRRVWAPRATWRERDLLVRSEAMRTRRRRAGSH
jgi:hypothetical protein